MPLNADAMLREHTGLVYSWADTFYFPGGDRDDVRQIALLALWDAIQTWDGERRFISWARTVVQCDLIDALSRHRSSNQTLLNESARTATNEDGQVVDILEFLPGGSDPVALIEQKEELRDLVERIQQLSPMERSALIRVVFCGEAYGIGYTKDKSTDQALQRARRKLAA